jgi:hypothetical protein
MIGGPLHRLGALLRLVNVETGHSVHLGIAIAAILWLALTALAFIEGIQDRIFSLSVIGGHARILIAIPLLFLCESAINPHLRRFTDGLISGRVVSGPSEEALRNEIQRFNRRVRSPLAELAIVLIAVASFWAPADAVLPGATGTEGASAPAELPLAAQWYWIVCLPVFRFLIFRWAWRLVLWWIFLWRVSRLDLNLLATHPDRAAGLGYLSSVHGAFVSLIAAISFIIAAALAEDIVLTGVTLKELYPMIAAVLVADAALFVAPMYMFISNLRGARSRGLITYMDLASGYVNAFDRKWVHGAPRDEPLLGSPDIQSLADLSSSIAIIEETRIAPVSHALFIRFGLWALIPLSPLLLFEFPLDELAARALGMLIGV